MPIQPLTSLETEHTRFLYESAYTPLSQQPYLLSTPFMEGDTYPIGSVFFLVFDSPSSDIQAEFASGVRRSLTFRMADGIAVTAPVSCVSYLFGQTLYVAFTLLSTIFLLPTPHLQQGASSMVFLPRDGSDAPVESVYANNGVGQVPLAGGTPHSTTDGKVVAPAQVEVTNFPSNGSAISSADGALASVGNTADAAYVSGAGTMIALLKAIFLKVAGTLGVNVTNWPSSQTISGSVSVSNLPTTQAISATDGSQATIGTTTDTTSANTLVGLLKAIKSALLSTLPTSVADGASVTVGAKADAAYADTSGATSGSFIALLKGLFVKVSGHALETGGNLAQVASNTANVANESGGHLANMDVTLGGQSDTAAASSSVAGSMMAFLKAILAAVISPVAPSYEYNSGVTGTVDRVRNAQGKGYATAAITTSGATVGQPVITLASAAPATLQVGMQIQLLGGTEEPADIVSISGTAVTLSANIVNASHTSIGWDTFAVNGPLASSFSAIGASLRGLFLYNPNGSVATPYQQAQSDGNGALKTASSDGSNVTIGTTTDAASTNTLVGLLKAIKTALLGTLGVSVSNFPASQTIAGTVSISNFPATQPESIVDGSDATQGAKADSAATDSVSSWSIVALLKGVYAKLASALSTIQPDVTTTGTITAAQPSIGTTVAGGYVTLAVGNGQSSWKAQLTGLTATDVIVIDHSSDGGTTWNSSNFIVAGAANNTPVSSVTAISGQVELSGNDSSVSHIKVRCSTYNTGDTIGVTIRAGFGIGRVGLITPLPAGSNSIGSVTVGTLPSLPAGTNQIGHVVLDSGTVSGIEYQWNGGAPNNQNYDRLRTVQALTPQTATISSGNSAASTAPVLSVATGLQPGQWVLLSNSTPASDATAEWVLTTSGYVAGTTTLALTSGIVTAGHTNAYWNAYTVFGPQASFFYWEGLAAQGLALNNGAKAVLAQGDAYGNLKTSGGFTELTGLSANAFAAASGSTGVVGGDLLPSTDVSSFKWWSIQITGTWAGQLTVQGSNDNTNWNAVLFQNSGANPTNSTTISSGSTGIFYGACMFRYLRIRMTTYTSGAANAVAEFYSSPAPLIVLGATQNGTWTVQPGNTANTTPWLVNTADGGQPTIGAKADSAYSDATGAASGSLVALLKGLYVKLTGTLAVSGTFWQATQPTSAASASFVDGSIVTAGTLSDSAASSGTGGSWTLAALLRGILNGIQGVQKFKGDFLEPTTFAVSTAAADLLPSTDVSAYKWVSVQLVAGTTPAWQGAITFQGSNDNSNWQNVILGKVDSASQGSSVSSLVGSIIYSGPLLYRYFRVRLTTATQGSISGTVELYTAPSTPMGLTTNASQNGTYTVQPGNTPNTVPWLASIHDGTNKANVFANGQANQNAALVAGAFTEQTGLSAGSLNANLVPPTEVSAYKWWSLHVTALASGGAISFQGSNDNTNWLSVEAYLTSSAAVFSTGASQVGIFYGACNFRYFRVVQTGWTSGATTGVLELYTNAGAFTTSPSLTSGSATIGGVFTKAGSTSTAIANGNTVTTNTVIKASNGNLGRILVTSLPTATQVQVNIYDSATTTIGSSNIIGIVKATAQVGDIIDIQMIGNAGIMVGGAAGNPGLTITWS